MADGGRLGLGHGTESSGCGVAHSADCGSDWGGTLALWGGLGVLSPSLVNRSGSDSYYGPATTRLLSHSFHTEDRLGNKDFHVSAITKPSSIIRSPRDIAFRSGKEPSSSTYIMCRSHYRLSRFL